jgi:D-sedoheptulose 7-phosphate isomerase
MPSSDDRLSAIRQYLHQGADQLRATADACGEDISRAVELIVACYRHGGKLLLCGNGGSAAQCQHLAAEFVNLLSRDRPRGPLAAIALTTDSSVLTAVANDRGFEEIFARQVEALGRPGDVLIALSTSGTSANVRRAVVRAREEGLVAILLTGASGDRSESGNGAGTAADLVIRTPCQETQQVQDLHGVLGHILCAEVERELA